LPRLLNACVPMVHCEARLSCVGGPSAIRAQAAVVKSSCRLRCSIQAARQRRPSQCSCAVGPGAVRRSAQ
jgi:hypothetical protein